MQASLQQFLPVIGKWFEERVGVPTPPQVLGWPVIGAAKSALILAPTGSGKTLAAFLAAIDWLSRRLMAAEEIGETVWGVQILYVSPLKSLANDIEKNLVGPLREIGEVAAGMRVAWPEIAVAVRTGDTPQKARAAIARRPPHILITTPESLNLMLTSGSRNVLATTRFVIVDEVHALAGSKRGVFLSLLLERLEQERMMAAAGVGGRRGVKIAPGVYVKGEELRPLVRIGLSATARPEEVIARWLAGCDERGEARAMEIVKSGQRKRLDLGVICPFGGAAEEVEWNVRGAEQKPRGTGHWPEVTRAVLRLIREHKSTLVFGNSRRLIERLAARFQDELRDEAVYQDAHPGQPTPRMPVILPHHGSIAKEVRLETEQALKRGEVDAVLATSSLELGIDIGALDLVVQIDSPGNVAGALQRVGRAGHLEKATAKGRLLARGRHELAALAALVPMMYAGQVEETRVPENCLDVLAQQMVAACVARAWKRGDLFRMFRRAMPYRGLMEKQFDGVVAMLSKRTERVTSQGLRPRLSFDRVNDELIIMPGAAQVVMMNSGVISDTGSYPVYLVGGKKGRIETRADASPREAAQGTQAGVRLGELDEEFVYETREGDRIVLGSQTWQVVRIDADRVLVEHAAAGSSRMPFWRGEQAPRSEMLGEAVVRFLGEMERRLGAEDDETIRGWLMETHKFDEQAAENAVGYYRRQVAAAAGAGLPTEKRIVVEHFTDRTGEPIIAVLCPLGRRVNYTLRLALEGQFAKRRLPTQIVHSDDGLIIRPPHEMGEIPESPLAWLKGKTLEGEIVDQLESTSLFGLRFRQNAARALMLPRMTVTQRTPLWQQRLRARHLLALVKKERNFPIIVETYRECLQDVLGIEAVEHLLGEIETGRVVVVVVHHGEPSPFARSLFSQFQQSYLYAWDDPLVQSEIEPAVDQTILDEILQRRGGGEAAPAAASWSAADEVALRRRIQGADYPARSAEELLEKIEAAGAVGVAIGLPEDLRWREWVVGGEEEVRGMLGELSGRSRLFVVFVQAERERFRWVAVENLGLLAAAMGKRPGVGRFEGGEIVRADWKGIPPAILATELTRAQARRVMVEQVMKSDATTTVEGVAGVVPWMGKEVAAIVEELVREGLVLKLAEGRVVWAEYAEQLRSMALRRERRAAATVDVAALQRHLLGWQHLDLPRDGSDALEDVLDLLLGLSFSLDAWEHEILPARVKDFVPAMLDGVCRTGRRVWVGSGGGGVEGVVSFWPRHLLGMRAAEAAEAGTGLSDSAGKILGYLREKGASFLLDVQVALHLDDGEAALALQELAFAGKISNDLVEGLREVERLAENVRRDRAVHSDHPRHPQNVGRYPAGLGGVGRMRGQRHLPGGWWKQRTGGAVLAGRWFVLPELQGAGTALEHTEMAAERVERFLRRTGFACRELLEAGVDGTWRDAYDVLTRMEWAGAVRRGYFVEGLGGSQFALPAVRLGDGAAAGGAGIFWVAMIDPANLWARLNTRWLSDAGEPARVARSSGNWIALVEGRPVLAVVNYGHRLIPLPAAEGEHQAALRALPALLPRLPRRHRMHLDVRYWDQQDIIGSPADETLRHIGFTRDTQGLRLYRQYVPQPTALPGGEAPREG